jgi:hypothetical protein
MGWVVISRVTLTGVCLGLLAAVGACAGGGTASDMGPASQEGGVRVLDGVGPDESRNPTADRSGPLPDGGAASCVESYAPKAVMGLLLPLHRASFSEVDPRGAGDSSLTRIPGGSLWSVRRSSWSTGSTTV